MYLFYFNLTRAPGSFLVTSTLNADDQPWTFKWARVQCKTCPFIYNVEKSSTVRIHLPNRYIWHNLLHAIEYDTRGRGNHWWCLGDRCPKKWHRCIKTCGALFQPSVKHAACSLFYTKESRSFSKALSFKSALKIPTESINAALSTNSLLFYTHCHLPGYQ